MKNILLSNTKEQVQNMSSEGAEEEWLNEDNVQLYFKGQKLDNDCSPLSEYGIQHKSVLQLVWGLGT
ncbi:uncharacterized protein AKAME5_002883500 [Lates japonicus]|uniref:Ubiquitin-like domain-containing protein n=1 Tax=Lates japonicus TaxID=270547 RepID=A0AAD3MSC6_LATJO|nr:uncharacterized protein AKAME5_002883500 [Lates japonicus]